MNFRRFSVGMAVVLGAFIPSARAASQTEEPRLRLIGNGALGITAGEDVSSGAFGLDFLSTLTRFQALITIESTAGNIESENRETFGEALLPIRSSDTGLFLLLRRSRMLLGGGLQGYLNTGSATWTLVSNGGTERRSEDLTTTAAGVNLIWDPFHNYTIENNDVRMLVGLGYTFRAISGDLAQGDEDEFRTDLLGTDDTFFHGPEAVATLQINDVEVTFALPFLFGDEVEGLTGGRPYGTINIQAGLDLGLKKRRDSVRAPAPVPPPPAAPGPDVDR